jgi:prepilin-type processing-associated H-X9-DG protein
VTASGALQEPYGGYFKTISDYQTPSPWGFGGFQMTHFRFSGSANVAFVDGHVETRQPVAVAYPAFVPQPFRDSCAKHNLGFLADNDLPYKGQ